MSRSALHTTSITENRRRLADRHPGLDRLVSTACQFEGQGQIVLGRDGSGNLGEGVAVGGDGFVPTFEFAILVAQIVVGHVHTVLVSQGQMDEEGRRQEQRDHRSVHAEFAKA